MGIGYYIADIFTQSDNEKKLAQYKKVKREIDNNIDNIKSNFELASDQLSNFEDTYNIDVNTNYGYVVDVYTQNASRFYDKLKVILDYYKQLINSLESDSQYAQTMIEKYEEACKKEDEEGRKN